MLLCRFGIRILYYISKYSWCRSLELGTSLHQNRCRHGGYMLTQELEREVESDNKTIITTMGNPISGTGQWRCTHLNSKKAIERLLEFIDCEEVTGEAICDLIINKLNELILILITVDLKQWIVQETWQEIWPQGSRNSILLLYTITAVATT